MADQINVLNPQGKLVSIPADRLQDALASGYKPDPQGPYVAPPVDLGAMANKATGFEKTSDSITPTVSPIDLVAGAAGSALGESLVADAGEVAGNEIGSIGSNVKLGKGVVDATDREGPALGTVANDIKQTIHPDYSRVTQESGGITENAGKVSWDKTPTSNYADGGDVQPDMQAAAAPGSAMPSEAPTASPVNVLNPEGELVSIPSDQLPKALQSGYTQASPLDIHKYTQTQKYGSTGQQVKAGLEGAAQGATFGLSTGLETALGVNPEDIRGRAEENPTTHMVGQGAGLAASSLIPGVGEAGLLNDAGNAAAGAVGLGKAGSGFISQVGSDTVKGAFEAAIFQGGEEVSKAFSQDPNQTAEHAIADIGLAGVMGGVFGGAVGAALRKAGLHGGASEAPGHEMPGSFVSEIDQPKLNDGDFRTSVQNSDILKPAEKEGILAGLKEEKLEAPAIRKAAADIDAPVLEGMISNSKWVQKAEDSLINGAPTYSGIKRQALYNEGYAKANAAVDNALGEGSKYSKAELGNIFKDSITSQISEENQPIAQMYSAIKEHYDAIPLSERSGPAIARNLAEIKDFQLSPSSPQGQLINRVMKDIGNLKTVDDVKAYKSMLNQSLSPTASPAEKRIVAIIGDKLTNLEEGSIERFAKDNMKTEVAKNKILGLIDQRKTANKEYKTFIEKVKTLSEQLGKGRVYGAQDAINFIRNELTPEQVTNRLFSKNNSEFLKFFSKEFPEQMELMRQYQKGVLREEASRTGELSPKLVFNKVNKLEPEIQKSVFSPEELSKLQSAETYLRAFPKNFNPSGTSGMSAFRSFFEHPTGAVIGNARDFAIEKFIQAVGHSPEVKQAGILGKATVSGWNTATRAVKAALNPDKAVMPAAITASVAGREKLKKLVDDYTANPHKMLDMNASNPVPAYNAAFAATSARAVSYLNSIKPDTTKKNPLDSDIKPNAVAEGKYNRALDVAQQPLSVLQHIQKGTLLPEDLVTLKAIYPNLYSQLTQQLGQQMITAVHKGVVLPYRVKLSLSMFMGQALDSSMTPQAIQSAQPKPAQGQPDTATMPKSGPKHSMNALNKLPSQYQTPGQARAQARAKIE